MYRRGNTIGLKLVGARIVRENGDVSGFFHTFIRAFAAILSFIPLGLGYAWALWDPQRQTWHDKIMHTYVMRDTPELAARQGTSSDVAKLLFWLLVVGLPCSRHSNSHRVILRVASLLGGLQNQPSWLPLSSPLAVGHHLCHNSAIHSEGNDYD